MKRELLAAAAAALTVGSSSASAQDVTFTWDTVGYEEYFPPANCEYLNICNVFYQPFSSTFSLTLPDNTFSTTTTQYYDSIHTISYKTLGGVLVNYDEFSSYPGVEMDDVYHLDLKASGGLETARFEIGPYQATAVELTYFYLPGTTPPSIPTNPPPIPEPAAALMLLAALSGMRLLPRRQRD